MTLHNPAPNDGHKVSVIIPTLGRGTLERTQAALAQQTRPADEVIVVMDRERRGLSWGRNEGIRRASGDLIAFTDDDCVPPPDWIERLVQAIDQHAAAVAGGTFKETDGLLADMRRRRAYPTITQVDTVGWVGNGGNIMYRRDWLERCAMSNGHIFDDETFKSLAEDWELIWRMRQQGARFVFVPNPVTHLRQMTTWGHLRQQFYRGRGIALLFRLQRESTSNQVVHDSLLWGQQGQKRRTDWLGLVVHKILGPFDVRSFSSWKNFAAFWLGEKFQGLGFLWGLVRLPYERSAPKTA